MEKITSRVRVAHLAPRPPPGKSAGRSAAAASARAVRRPHRSGPSPSAAHLRFVFANVFAARAGGRSLRGGEMLPCRGIRGRNVPVAAARGLGPRASAQAVEAAESGPHAARRRIRGLAKGISARLRFCVRRRPREGGTRARLASSHLPGNATASAAFAFAFAA